MEKNEFTIAAYYFPNYHLDHRNQGAHGSNWTEWDLVKKALPRFPGHKQPKIPLWGYEDESNPEVMKRKIDIAGKYNINVFLFDWYWYDDGPYLHRALENGFLRAENANSLNFAIHWANHDWLDIHPAKYYAIKLHQLDVLYEGSILPKTFDKLTDYVISNYFFHPSYWKIEGSPYFSIYDINNLVRSFGGIESTRVALARFREKTIEAGFPNLHLNQVLWNVGILPGEEEVLDPGSLLKTLGFDSFTSYVWVHHVELETFPKTDYLKAAREYFNYWDRITKEIDLPYFPNITMGWDSSPRTVQSDCFENIGYPFTPILYNNTPDNFTKALKTFKEKMVKGSQHRIFTINAWNEWTEGSYLEPDAESGYTYLQSIRNAFENHESNDSS